MIVLRNAQSTDLDGIVELAQKSTIGLTTLPKNKELLKKRLQLSTQSFKKNVEEPANEYYLFVLEDTINQKIIGTSAIQAITGYDIPFYSYHVSTYSRKSPTLNKRTEYKVLNLVNDNQGRSEICTLFLDPDYRGQQIGFLLSKARFLFIAQQRHRFTMDIIAELRGFFNEKDESPFWEHVGRHFFQMSYAEVDQLILTTNNQFIEDLMPQFPIYLPLLADEAQGVIGKPHQFTLPAMKLLLQEGFRYKNYVHIFDAGPALEAEISDIRTINLSRELIVNSIKDEVMSQRYLVANKSLDFRAVSSFVLVNELDNSCAISEKTASTLQITCGDTIIISPMDHYLLHKATHD